MTDAAPVVHLNSWAGAGKLTIARTLAPMIGARLLDKHTLMNPALAVQDRGTPAFRALRQALRDLTFDAAARLPAETPIVLTDAFSDDPYEEQLFEDVTTLAQTRRAPLIRVILDISEAENIRRLTQPARAEGRKLTDPDILRNDRANHVLLGHNHPQAIHLDVTDLTPQKAAETLLQRAPPLLLLAKKTLGVGGE